MSLILLLALTAASPADWPSAEAIAERLRATQLTGMFVHDRTRTTFRATVIGKEGPMLTVLTAAHCLGPAEVGSPVRLSRGEKVATGRIQSVVRNPNYRPAPSRDIPGADNALAWIQLDDGGTLTPDRLGTAEMVSWPMPVPSGGIVTVWVIDQFEAHHVVRAGNYTNPRWLEWGAAYRPVPGDSGSGVFVARTEVDGTVSLRLIGSVVDRSERGGGASLVQAKDRWFLAAMPPRNPDR